MAPIIGLVGSFVIAVLTIPSADVRGPAPQRRPIVRPAVPVLYPPIPATLDGLVTSGDLTGVFRISAVKPKVIERGRSRTIVTCSQAQIVEVLRYTRTELLGKVVEVCQNGGLFQTPDGLVDFVDRRFPRFRNGMKLLLVLRWHPGYRAYESVFGPDSSYELAVVDQQEVVRTFGITPLAREQRRRPADEFLADVRARIR